MAVTERARDDRGAAVVVAIGVVAVLVFVAAVSVGTVAIVLAHRRAQVAADLASLAGAAALRRGADPCSVAATIAARHDAALTSCLTEGTTVLVVTSVRLPAALGGQDAPARARAGPAEQGGQSSTAR
jgi:secretion/DNA translocation related TadE-like protein